MTPLSDWLNVLQRGSGIAGVKSHALMEYNGGLEKAILRDSELLSEVNDAFCKSHPLLAQKVVTRSPRSST